MKIQDFWPLLDSAEKHCYAAWYQPGHLCVAVNRSCLETTLGHFPRRLDFTSQNDFHDAYYSWVAKAKTLSTEMLKNLAEKHKLSAEIHVDSWEKPVLFIKTTT